MGLQQLTVRGKEKARTACFGLPWPTAAKLRLAPFLRRVVFVCKAALRGGFTTFAPAATAKLN